MDNHHAQRLLRPVPAMRAAAAANLISDNSPKLQAGDGHTQETLQGVGGRRAWGTAQGSTDTHTWHRHPAWQLLSPPLLWGCCRKWPRQTLGRKH